MFNTVEAQAKLLTDTSYIVESYQEAPGVVKTCYGRINTIISHQMYPDDGAPKHVLVSCDWFVPEGTNPRNGLPRVRLCENFNSSRWCFLRLVHNDM